MQPTTSNNNFQSIFPYHAHNQVSFDNLCINWRGIIYLGIFKMSFKSYVFKRSIYKSSRWHINKGSQKSKSLTTCQLLQVATSYVSKNLNLNVSRTKKDVAPKQRYNRLLSVEGHIHATSTFEHALATPRPLVIGGSQKSKEQNRFLRIFGHSDCDI